ncbi:TPA: hypothetical protein UMF74_000458 [Stenotrophomonas maltophilia]|jgi:hypothetical protein|uniref:hypothetical protein n=1 Tax=Stenotrophomonas TaxID=40323 RepID=UPI00066C2950|nr:MULTISPECIES: hypothetical protein [Stenotrophomonas]NED67766.1 hypothetical protein [Streptomyces sp. SID10244]HAV4432544.1 hypothetical protein [Acinetobacter baumannii]KRG53387.1 hypothetical protein ARC02_12305 [Stenotrophomonas maltophilia]MBN4968936.1 hypothetical protein [Stenotrophomonas maltophilia]MBN5090830.1 hypothetical protein [Stenotrophomonas maltophilia]
MSLCVALGENGTLIPTGQPVDQCTGYVLMSSAEASSVAMFAEAFKVPDKDVLAGWASGPFILIMTLYLAAHIGGRVAAVFDKS